MTSSEKRNGMSDEHSYIRKFMSTLSTKRLHEWQKHLHKVKNDPRHQGTGQEEDAIKYENFIRKELAKRKRVYVRGRAASPAANKRLQRGKHGTVMISVEEYGKLMGFQTHYPHESKRRKKR